MITGVTNQFEDESASIADEAMDRLAETDEVFGEQDATSYDPHTSVLEDVGQDVAVLG